uniref:NR LBD domain-containing protein n=1 Tax=Steinernema glaseri TaxID=37863 RepID=A0A1I7YZ87_9BILA
MGLYTEDTVNTKNQKYTTEGIIIPETVSSVKYQLKTVPRTRKSLFQMVHVRKLLVGSTREDLDRLLSHSSTLICGLNSCHFSSSLEMALTTDELRLKKKQPDLDGICNIKAPQYNGSNYVLPFR